VQALAESGGNFEDALITSDHEHLPHAVVNCRTAVAPAQMLLGLLAHFGRRVREAAGIELWQSRPNTFNNSSTESNSTGR